MEDPKQEVQIVGMGSGGWQITAAICIVRLETVLHSHHGQAKSIRKEAECLHDISVRNNGYGQRDQHAFRKVPCKIRGVFAL